MRGPSSNTIPFSTYLVGGKLVYQRQVKPASFPVCPISGQRLNGVSLRRTGCGRREGVIRRHHWFSRVQGLGRSLDDKYGVVLLKHSSDMRGISAAYNPRVES